MISPHNGDTGVLTIDQPLLHVSSILHNIHYAHKEPAIASLGAARQFLDRKVELSREECERLSGI